MNAAKILMIWALGALASVPALASDEAAQTMADMLIGMDHC
jgi:hypothetical protein